MRQLKQIRTGTTVLELKGMDRKVESSPFEMVTVPAAAPNAPYHPLDGLLGEICRDSRQQMYAVGLGMFTIATALVLGAAANSKAQTADNSQPELKPSLDSRCD
jgi:hypothetical protein